MKKPIVQVEGNNVKIWKNDKLGTVISVTLTKTGYYVTINRGDYETTKRLEG